MKSALPFPAPALRPVLMAALIALAACSPGNSAQADARPAPRPAAAPARHPVSGLAVIPLTVTSGTSRHRFAVEVARTPAEQEKGLMFRTAMGADEGMVFLRDPPGQAYFWMRNTVIPLDIIYIGTDHRILNIVTAVPYDETPLPSAGPAAAVLELNGGRAAQLGIKPGDKVVW